MWKLAWRNLWRNRTRTAIGLVSISMGYGLLLFVNGVQDDSFVAMMNQSAKMMGGDVLIHGEGWWEDASSDQFIPEPEKVVDTVKAVEGVKAVGIRVVASGLLSSPRSSAGAELKGIDPALEKPFTDYGRFLKEGTFLAGSEKRPLVLGSGIVQKLGVKLGDRIVLTTNDVNGEMTRALFKLSGIIDSGNKGLDDSLAYTTIPEAQKAVGLGKAVTQVGVLTEQGTEVWKMKENIMGKLGTSTNLELLTFREAAVQMEGLIKMKKDQSFIMFFLIFVVVAFGIANTLLMSVMERIRELGLQAALGLSPGQVGRLIMAETFILCVLGMAIGFVLGFSGHLYLSEVGIDYAALAGQDIEVAGITLSDYIMRSYIDVQRWITSSIMVFVVIMTASIYPARKAGKLEPSKAMRTYL
jgi:ABC-type lipoprotein release transport system permease subunit